MFNRDDSLGETLLGTAVLSAMFYFQNWCGREDGRQSAFKEMKDACDRNEIEELKRQINELKRKA